MERDSLPPSIGALLASAGCTALHSFEYLAKGANSTVYRALCEDGRALAIKRYGPNAPGRPDRLENEFASFQLLWEHGLQEVPEPIALDRAERLAVYGFIQGGHVAPGQIRREDVLAACRFFTRLQGIRRHVAAGAVPPAAEACFSFEEHLEIVGTRLTLLSRALEGYAGDHALGREARAFVDEECAAQLRNLVARFGEARSDELATPLEPDERVLSPSDFGFNNILVTPQGEHIFIDFEYFGWDDPTKTVVDFCLQPDRPLPLSLAIEVPQFLESLAGDTAWVRVVKRRLSSLIPLLRLKWSLIMLNPFRREHVTADALKDQLDRARVFLSTRTLEERLSASGGSSACEDA